jgi:sulfate permease, SulP family
MSTSTTISKQPRFGFDLAFLNQEWRDMFNGKTMVPDIWAGITVALVALPLNLALAIAAGVDPGVGITTGVIAGVIGSLFGGQRFAVTGPAAAMAVVLIGIGQTYGIQGIWLVGLIAGILQIVAGLFRCGKLISYIPMPVMVGFANAIGTLIIFNSLDDFCGLSPTPLAHPGQPAPLQGHPLIPEFLQDITAIFWRLAVHHEGVLPAFVVAIVTFGVAAFLPRVFKAIPAQLVAIVVGTALASGLNLPIPRIHDISSVPNYLPLPSLPNLPWEQLDTLFASAITVFMLGSIESLLSASVADGMTMTKHKPDQELIGQGLANVIVPFFGGIPVTGVIARTAVNVRSGAKTRLSGIVHSLTLMLLIFFLAKYADQIPLSALSGILVLTGLRLIEWDEFREIWRASKTEAWIMLITTAVSVMVDLTAGVMAGLVFTAALFVRQMSAVRVTALNAENGNGAAQALRLPNCKYVQTFTVDGPLFFGAAERFIENIIVYKDVRVVILNMRAVSAMDVTGVRTLLSIHSRLSREGCRLIIAELPSQPMELLERSSSINILGRENIFKDYEDAVVDADLRMLRTTCSGCAGGLSETLGVKKITQLGAKDCPLKTALASDASPAARLLMAKIKPEDLVTTIHPETKRLVNVSRDSDIPKILRNTPIEVLLKSNNMGKIDIAPSDTPELLIGMCIDYRKSLYLPRDWAFVLRREGANMLGAEFALALGMSMGTKYMALIGHDNCAMSRPQNNRDNFIKCLTEEHGWNTDLATHFFEDHIRSHEIGNEIDFILEETNRLKRTFKGLTIVPMLYRLEDNKLYLIKDWLDSQGVEVANNHDTEGAVKP